MAFLAKNGFFLKNAVFWHFWVPKARYPPWVGSPFLTKNGHFSYYAIFKVFLPKIAFFTILAILIKNNGLNVARLGSAFLTLPTQVHSNA